MLENNLISLQIIKRSAYKKIAHIRFGAVQSALNSVPDPRFPQQQLQPLVLPKYSAAKFEVNPGLHIHMESLCYILYGSPAVQYCQTGIISQG